MSTGSREKEIIFCSKTIKITKRPIILKVFFRFILLLEKNILIGKAGRVYAKHHWISEVMKCTAVTEDKCRLSTGAGGRKIKKSCEQHGNFRVKFINLKVGGDCEAFILKFEIRTVPGGLLNGNITSKPQEEMEIKLRMTKCQQAQIIITILSHIISTLNISFFNIGELI